MVDDLQTELSSREQQLGVLENMILTRELNKQVYPEGRPVQDGFISSYFGRRADPFTGYLAVHKGLDFAGPAGSKVSSVAAGLVTFAGERAGFGEMVEINHGNGLATRYCHNEKILVKQGDMVGKGQEVALMGSTGHSTGPHLHFEVLKDGDASRSVAVYWRGALGHVRRGSGTGAGRGRPFPDRRESVPGGCGENMTVAPCFPRSGKGLPLPQPLHSVVPEAGAPRAHKRSKRFTGLPVYPYNTRLFRPVFVRTPSACGSF